MGWLVDKIFSNIFLSSAGSWAGEDDPGEREEVEPPIPRRKRGVQPEGPPRSDRPLEEEDCKRNFVLNISTCIT